MKISATDIRVGDILDYNNGLYSVLKTMHVQPGKGGAYMQVEMKEIKKHIKINNRFRSSENVTKAFIEDQSYQFLYFDGDYMIFMDPSTFEQISLNKNIIDKDEMVFLNLYLKDGININLKVYSDEVIGVVLPETIVLKVIDCESSMKGQTITSSYKPAELEGEIRVMVPQFINSGDLVVINTKNKEYLERAK